MTRPQIVRADTLDLQDHDTPSAKDHTNQPEHPAPLGGGRPAPHQERSIRHAKQDSISEIMGGPGVDNSHDCPDSVDVYGDSDDVDGDIGRNGQYEEDGDLADGESDDLLDDDLMDKISSSPSIDDEDIDFEFVYALHNFVATVDGQANAAKGDTMVLLDDSNSYWWLVRVVKDGSIGYLPAEHIETPTERLARLNKHRNVDLSATMLGDNSEKSKNPLKKAMRRRNAKTVNFAAPTYIEASDVEFSSDEDSEHGDFFDDETLDGEEEETQDQNEDIVVEPLRPRAQKERPVDQSDANGIQDKQEPERPSSEQRRSSEEFFDPEEPTVSRSRNGTVRNTDSFFKDDTAEPKKMSLTPSLLRDESNNTTLSNDGKEGRGSLESDKASILQDKVKDDKKDDKKRKEKKPGMLSGLFKRKDKKSKSADDDIEETEKSPVESFFRVSPQPKTSMESLSHESRPLKSQAPQRQTSNKLQKQPPPQISPNKVDTAVDSPKDTDKGDQSMRQVAAQEATNVGESRESLASPVSRTSRQTSPSKEPFVTPLERMGPFASPVEQQSSEAQRRELYASPDGMSRQVSVTSPPQEFVPMMMAGYREAGAESPVDVSPMEAHIPIVAPGLSTDSSSQRDHSVSPLSPSSSPEADASGIKAREPTSNSLDRLSVDAAPWSDASLRSYLDDDNDIRDLFIIVHDKSNITPAGPDHPITGRLFKEESKRLKEMTTQLDEMLVSWMSQRARQSSPMRQTPPI